jgi:hypothetical protein
MPQALCPELGRSASRVQLTPFLTSYIRIF